MRESVAYPRSEGRRIQLSQRNAGVDAISRVQVWRSERRDARGVLIVWATNCHTTKIRSPRRSSLGLLRTLSGSCEKEGRENQGVASFGSKYL